MPALGAGGASLILAMETKDNMSGKGDKQRPTDHAAYSANYDAIFGKKNKLLGNGVAENTTDFDSVVSGLNPGSPATNENSDLNESVE